MTAGWSGGNGGSEAAGGSKAAEGSVPAGGVGPTGDVGTDDDVSTAGDVGIAGGEPRVVLDIAHAGFRYHDAAQPEPHAGGAPEISDVPAQRASGSADALTDVTLRVGAGRLVAVLGPQRSGTSTLCRLAAGLLADRGQTWGRVDRSGTVAMLGDDPEAQLTGLTTFVRDEVRAPGRLSGTPAGRTSAKGMATGEAVLDSLGIAHLAGRRLDTLSGGERQAVAIASLMTLRPALLVLDQPSLSLDAAARARLLDTLAAYRARGGAVLLTGHQHDELSAAADALYFVDSGRLVAGGVSLSRDAERSDAATAASPARAAMASHGVWDTLAPATTASAASPDPTARPATATGSTVAGRQGAWTRPVDAASPPATMLRAEGLRVSMGGVEIIRDAPLVLGAGRVATIMGPNGAGKSTLLRALAGLLEKSASVSGRIAGPEGRLDELPAHLRAATLAWVGQDPGAQLSAATVRSELTRAVPLPHHRRREGRRVRAERAAAVAALLERSALADVADAHPYDLPPDRRKDLVIATALLMSPAVLLLDEPTLGRDAAGIARLDALIAQHVEAGGAVLATTHDPRWAAASSDVRLELSGGRLRGTSR